MVVKPTMAEIGRPRRLVAATGLVEYAESAAGNKGGNDYMRAVCLIHLEVPSSARMQASTKRRSTVSWGGCEEGLRVQLVGMSVFAIPF